MKILIRQLNTKLYMNSGDWIMDEEQAHDFMTGGDAIKFAVKHDLKKVEIIYAFPLSEYNFSVKISDRTIPPGQVTRR